MMGLKELKEKTDIIDLVDWEMTPEEAVRLYLEWGNNWAGGRYVIRSRDDVSHYFVVNNWGDRPVVYLIRRNSDEADELAKFHLSTDIETWFLTSVGNKKGTYAVEGRVREWIRGQLGLS